MKFQSPSARDRMQTGGPICSLSQSLSASGRSYYENPLPQSRSICPAPSPSRSEVDIAPPYRIGSATLVLRLCTASDLELALTRSRRRFVISRRLLSKSKFLSPRLLLAELKAGGCHEKICQRRRYYSISPILPFSESGL